MKRRIGSILMALVLCITGLLSFSVQAQAKDEVSGVVSGMHEPSRVINVVYDDSGSMIYNKTGQVDTWCRAKYAMEVFAAMLGDNDVMNIYVMSDFQNTDDAPPIKTLKGSSSDASNVAAIHDMVTPAAMYTTFSTVEKAYADLRGLSGKEKWLVVLTDGEFNGTNRKTPQQLEAYFGAKDADINVMFLGMGAEASDITPDEKNHVYFEKAETSADILSKITKICNRIFNTNKLDVNASTGEFEFDVPMGELIVFAQGENVKITSVTGANGKLPGGSDAVGVKYSEIASTNTDGKYSVGVICRDLEGTLIDFKGLYDAGKYKIEAQNATTIEVYYKPSVDIMAYLIDKDGKEIRSNETVEPGDYTLKFNFVKPGTNEKVEESKLLGEVTYSAYVDGVGIDSTQLFKSGDPVTLSEGHYHISASAELPQFYTTVSSELDMDVFWHRELEVSSGGDNPVYYIDKDTTIPVDGFTNAEEPTIIKLSLDGSGMTQEEWDKIAVPEVEQIDNKDFRVAFTAEKGSEIGVIEIHPYLKSGKTDILNEYHDIDIRLTFNVDMAGQEWNGEVETTIPIVDDRPWYWKHLDKVWKLAVLGLILFIIAGYLPIFKKYLPKKLKGQPTIDCKPNKPGQKKYERKGKYTKNRLTTFIPYKAETGTIKFIPTGVSGPAALKVKATESGRRMDVTNTQAYANAKGLTFNGNPVEKGSKKNVSLTAAAIIVYKTADTTYSCTLNR